jgi:predicted ATPase/transcriptional regulator with XRE-family HTH domain
MDTEEPGTREQASFGAQLKRYRVAAGLSQEVLAERASVSVPAISAYERGLRQAPYRDTVALLAHALGLSTQEAAALEATVSRRRALPPTQQPLHPCASSPRHNLPQQPNQLLGREADMTALPALLGATRLLTLTGAAGSGKTRLAQQLALVMADRFSDGVFFVDLTPIVDRHLVAATIAQALGVQEAESRSYHENLRSYLRDRQVLLLLDNFEHVLGAAALVADLLSQCARLKILITSRAALHLRGEQEYPVLPLALPDLRALPRVELLPQYAAVALFIQRAANVRPEFRLTDANAPAVAEICHRLDGLPLAIELAAARSKLLQPEALVARLQRRLTLLTGGARDLPARQQTLRNAIAWSHNLLPSAEQRLFRRLAVFVGGSRLAEAEAVCDAAHDLGIDLLDGIASLLDQSLLWQQAAEPVDGHPPAREPRVGMLETIREYALECLAGSGEADQVRGYHSRAFLDVAKEAGPKLRTSEARTWLPRLKEEHDNLRAALAWSLDGGDEAVGLELAAALGEFWLRRGHFSEGRVWLQRALARRGTPTSIQPGSTSNRADSVQALCWETWARLHEFHGDMLGATGHAALARAAFARALALIPGAEQVRQARLQRKIGVSWSYQKEHGAEAAAYDLAETLLGPESALVSTAWQQEWIEIQIARVDLLYNLGDWPAIAMHYARAAPLARAVGTPHQRARFVAHFPLGVAFRQQRYVISDETLATARAQLAAWDQVDDVRGLAEAHFQLGFCLLWRGALDEAQAQLTRALALIERLGLPTEHACFLTYLAILCRKRRWVEEVRRLSAQSEVLAAAAGNTWYVGAARANRAWVAWCEGNYGDARSDGMAALDCWHGSAYPFQWIALWPLLAVELLAGALASAIEHARALLAPTQQPLPAALAAVLEETIRARERDQMVAARASLETALHVAGELGYL